MPHQSHMEKQGPVTLFFLGSNRGTTYHLPSSGTTHPIPDNQPYPKRPSRVSTCKWKIFLHCRLYQGKGKIFSWLGKKKKKKVPAFNWYSEKEWDAQRRGDLKQKHEDHCGPFRSHRPCQCSFEKTSTPPGTKSFQFTVRVKRAPLLGNASHLH